jgi:hypothetical protein
VAVEGSADDLVTVHDEAHLHVVAAGPPDPTNDPTGDFAFSANEAGATFQCRVDGATFASCPAVFATASLADGAHTLDVRAVDGAGTVDTTPASRNPCVP